MDIVNNLN